MPKSMLGLVAAAALSAAAAEAAADPILECGLMTEGAAELSECLNGQLEVSHGAMNEMLGLARGAAQEVDRVAGGDVAVLAVEASQHAWEAYRDTECQSRAIFAGAGAAAGSLELACAIELTRERTDALLRLAVQRGG